MSKKPATSTRTIIDEDNLYEILYHMLWHKDMFQPSANLPIFIPDTVLFRPGMPVAWYFSDSEGVMKRKLEANLTIPNIMETFLKKKSKYGIVAYYIYLSDTIKEDNNDPEQSDQTIIEYYDEPAFKKLLSNPHQLKKGILQRFIDPQGDRNSLIQCIWTRRICMFNRRTNFRLLKDNNANIYEKFVTFEGPPHMSEASALKGTALPIKLKQALDFIHISTATFERYQVSKFVCYLKVDDQNRIWYLYSGFFRVSRKVLDAALKVSEGMRQETDPIELNENLRIPPYINVGTKSGARTSKVPESLATCPRCSHIYSSSNFVEVNYKMILEAAEKPGDTKSAIEEFDHTPEVGVLLAPKDKAEGGEEDGNKLYRVRTKQTSIPYIIRKVHTRMKAHEFEELRDEDYFNNKKARVCYNCYFYISKTNNFGGNDLNPYLVRDKALHPRPIGQTLDVNKKDKKTDKARTTTVSGKANLSRTHSMASLDEDQRASFSVSKTKRSTSRQRQTANQENSWMDSQGRAISRGKEEVPWSGTSVTRSQILDGDEQKRGFRSTVGSEVQKYEQELEEMIQENIFKKHQSGQILNLGGFEKRKRSYENINAALPTTLSFGRGTEMMSRATSMSHQTDGLYNHMKGQNNRSKVEHDYHEMTYDHEKIAEYQEEYLQEISENRPQSKMSGPRYRIPNISTNRRESTRAGLGSQTERISMTGGGNFSSLLHDRSSHRDIINQKSLNMNKVNGFNAQRSQSTQRGYAEHASDTVKAYFGKQADRLLAKRSTSLVRFLKNGPSVPIHKSKDFTTRANYDYKKPEKVVLRELQTSHIKALDAELEGDWYIVPPKITKEDRSYSNPAFIASKTERTKSGLLTNEGDSVNLKTFEKTNASQFPHMKDQGKLLSAYNPMPIHNLSKSNEQVLANSNEAVGVTSDLFEYSNTLPLKSSMMLKETTEGNNPKETVITVVENEAKKELKTLSKNTEQETASKEPYLRTLTQQEFQTLTGGGQRRGDSRASSILSKIESEILVSQKDVKSESRSRKGESYPQTMIEYESDLINKSIANPMDKVSESKEMISYDITNSQTRTAKVESRKSEVEEKMSDSRDPSSESSEFDDEGQPQESEAIRTETEVEVEKNQQEEKKGKIESDYDYDYEELEDISEAISEAIYRESS